MGHWNYRVIKKLSSSGEYEYGIHEVYYDKDGNVEAWSENSLVPACPSKEDLLQDLERMKGAFEKEVLVDEEGE